MDKKSDYGKWDSKKKDLADKELAYLEMKCQYYMLKISMLYLYEKCKAKPDMRALMNKLYEALKSRESCLLDVDCDIHEMINRFEEYSNDRERLAWFEEYILN